MLKVSIITICYNSDKTIDQTIKSVINQTYPNIEYIIVDGGSTDGTLEIIRHYEAHITRWISEPDNGIYDAMNKGISLATGDVIGTINSDDWYAEGVIDKIVTVFKNDTSVELVYGDVEIVGTETLKRESMGSSSAIPNLKWYWQPALFVKSSVYKKYGIFNTKYLFAADVAYFLRLDLWRVQTQYISEIVAYFRLGGISSNRNFLWKKAHEFIKIFSDILSEMPLQAPCRKVYERYHKQAIYASKGLVGNYIMKRLLKNGKQHDFWQWLLKKNNKRSYVIWGTGHDGEMIWQDNPTLHTMMICCVDNNQSSANSTFHGLSVYKPQDNLSKDNFIIVSSSRYAEEISTELITMGFKAEFDFYVYNDEAFSRCAIKFMKVFR